MKQLIWDLPTRIFHWALAISVVLAFAIAEFAPEDSWVFMLHIVFGVTAGLLMVWRLVWGFVGGRYARFSSLIFSLPETLGYFTSVLKGKGQYYEGHNPGSALAIWGIFALVIGIVTSGLLMGFGEVFEEIHEVLPVLLMGVVVVHVIGVFLASKMHGENYAVAMVTGKKSAKIEAGLKHSSPLAAMVMVAFVATGLIYFAKGFDPANGTLNLAGLGYTLQIGEGEDHEHGGSGFGNEDDDDDDDDHDDD